MELPVSARPKVYNLPLSLRFIADWEERVSRQKQLVTELKEKGQPTKHAEAALKEYQASLLQLRNHAQIMLEIMQPRKQGL
jgi:hypothetical protein